MRETRHQASAGPSALRELRRRGAVDRGWRGAETELVDRRSEGDHDLTRAPSRDFELKLPGADAEEGSDASVGLSTLPHPSRGRADRLRYERHGLAVVRPRRRRRDE